METPNIYQELLFLKSYKNPNAEQLKRIKELEEVINKKEVIY